MNRRKFAGWLVGGMLLLLFSAVPAQAADWFGWLPESASAEADEIDALINLVTVIVLVTFIAVTFLMLLFMIKYRAKPGVKAKHTHGNHTVEMIWTIAPALILVFLALYQMDIWTRMKGDVPREGENPVAVQIFAKQYEWNFRYPGADGDFGTADDIYTVKQLVLPIGRPMDAEMRSMDVLHSFFLPNMRFKNDAVPGVPMKVWVRPNKLSKDRRPIKKLDGSMKQLDYWDIVCAELCGLGHTTMGGELFVLSNEDFELWMKGDKTVCRAIQVAQYPDDDTNIWFRWPWQDNTRTVPGPPKWTKSPFREDDKGSTEDDEDDE